MALGCLIAITGCSTRTRDRVLRVFFTGIDQPAAVPDERPEARPARTTALPVAPSNPPLFTHQPYAENNCAACHLGTQSQELRATGNALCRECHPTLLAQAKFVHTPVADGECKACHAPHESTEPRLLIAKGQAVCTECHELPDLAKVKGHETMGTDVCWSCHDPHRSDKKGLLKGAP